MDTSGFPFPKPKDKKKRKPDLVLGLAQGVRYLRDGREICDKTRAGKLEYKRRHRIAWERDRLRPTDDFSICGICGFPVTWEESTVDHKIPRGIGGAFHDDRVENMQPAHLACNQEKGSQRDYVKTSKSSTDA